MTLRIRFGWEPLSDLLATPGTPGLIRDYWAELSPLKGAVPLDPDWDEMLRLEARGRFRVWVCRADGALAGVIAFHLIEHMNCRGTLFAIDAGHYLAPAFRNEARIGYRMWKAVEPALLAEGVKVVMAHDNLARPLMPFFLSLGYEPASVVFRKVIG